MMKQISEFGRSRGRKKLPLRREFRVLVHAIDFWVESCYNGGTIETLKAGEMPAFCFKISVLVNKHSLQFVYR